MRLFIAIDTREVHDYLNEITSHIKAKTVSSFHLTLKFLGEVDDKLDEILCALDDIRFSEFRLVLSDIGFFPGVKSPRVVFVGVKPWAQIIELQNKVDDSLISLGFKKETKFHPHITLARVRNRFSMDKILIRPMIINVSSFILVRSRLTSDGPIYDTQYVRIGNDSS